MEQPINICKSKFNNSDVSFNPGLTGPLPDFVLQCALKKSQACSCRIRGSQICNPFYSISIDSISSSCNLFQEIKCEFCLSILVCIENDEKPIVESIAINFSLMQTTLLSYSLDELHTSTASFSATLVAVIIVASLVLVVALTFLLIFLYLRRKRVLQAKDEEGAIPLIFLEELSNGSFGVVWRASRGGQTVAAKKLYSHLPRSSKFKVLRMFIQEAKIMMLMKHPRIVQYIDFDHTRMAIIMEYMPLGSLQSYIMDKKSITWTDRIQVIRDVTEGMAYLHAVEFNGEKKADVFHQDLKSANVLLKKEQGVLRAKISDFGLSSTRRQ